jgi:SAM-dependent methyltransferase
MGDDPYAPFKERAWREVAAIDAQLEHGEIDEDGWHRAMADLVVPAYLAAETPWGGSGKNGDAANWERSRSLLGDAIDRGGTFLDVGCANGYLMESLPRWTTHTIEPYGLDISPALAALARERLPAWADRIWVGNARAWEPPTRFTYIRTGLEYAPPAARRDLVVHLLRWCDRLIVGVYNEQANERLTEQMLRTRGFSITGRTEREHTEPSMRYRCLWIDA